MCAFICMMLKMHNIYDQSWPKICCTTVFVIFSSNAESKQQKTNKNPNNFRYFFLDFFFCYAIWRSCPYYICLSNFNVYFLFQLQVLFLRHTNSFWQLVRRNSQISSKIHRQMDNVLLYWRPPPRTIWLLYWNSCTKGRCTSHKRLSTVFSSPLKICR